MLRTTVEERIRAVFPKGNDWEREDKALDANDYAERVQYAIDKICLLAPLSVRSQRRSDHHCDEFIFTHIDDPSIESWVGVMDNASKLQWIKNKGKPYVAFWLKVSRVADYYMTFFNHWRPRGNTGYLDSESREEPSIAWVEYSQQIFEQLEVQGFLPATRDFLNEKVPFVLTWGGDEIPDGDPRWDDDNFEPDSVPSVVYDCLFGDQ